MSNLGKSRGVWAQLQSVALLLCLLLGALHGVVAVALYTPDCCMKGICPAHRSHKSDDAMAECDHEHGGAKSDCAMKCGMPKVDLAGILPSLPEMIFPAGFAEQELTAERFKISAVNVAVPQALFSPPEQPPRS